MFIFFLDSRQLVIMVGTRLPVTPLRVPSWPRAVAVVALDSAGPRLVAPRLPRLCCHRGGGLG